MDRNESKDLLLLATGPPVVKTAMICFRKASETRIADSYDSSLARSSRSSKW